MTDIFNALVVILDKDMREDDAETLLTAIRQLRGVLSVSGNISDINSHIAEQRVKSELANKLFEVVYPKLKS